MTHGKGVDGPEISSRADAVRSKSGMIYKSNAPGGKVTHIRSDRQGCAIIVTQYRPDGTGDTGEIEIDFRDLSLFQWTLDEVAKVTMGGAT